MSIFLSMMFLLQKIFIYLPQKVILTLMKLLSRGFDVIIKQIFFFFSMDFCFV